MRPDNLDALELEMEINVKQYVRLRGAENTMKFFNRLDYILEPLKKKYKYEN